MMFNLLIKTVESQLLKSNDFTIESIDNLNNFKLSIVLIKSQLKMGSIELLVDGTCDFFIIDYESENVLFSETIKFKDLSSLEFETIKFLELFKIIV